jgi:hypothetical protein
MDIVQDKIKTYTFLFISCPLLRHIFIMIMYILLYSYFSNPIFCDDTLSSGVGYSAGDTTQEERFLQLKAIVLSELDK